MTNSTEQSVDVVVVGAGFAGLYLLHRLRSAGFALRGFERGEDVGGTWYWNRYPGARCDVESMDYSFSFDPVLEQEWEWTERFATQPEILRYLQHVADRFDLRRLISFSTEVQSADWDEDAVMWRVLTSAGETLFASFLILATGSLSQAKVPDIPGLRNFSGQLLSTADWPKQGVSLAGRRVGVIGTGSTGIQAIPLIAAEAEQLIVFQRTPGYSIPARNAPLAAEFVAEMKGRYRSHRREMRASFIGVPLPSNGQPAAALTEAEQIAALDEAWRRGGQTLPFVFVDTMINEDTNALVAAYLRARIREIVKDSSVAEVLTPRSFPIGSKRVAVDTDYYATFNRSNVSLRDLRTTPLRRIVAEGVELSDGLVPIDTLVLAIGFDAMTGSFLRIRITNGPRNLAEHWNAGPATYLGLMSEGFPNLFFVAGPGSPSVLSNMVVSIEQHVEWITDCLTAMRNARQVRIEPTAPVEREWVQHVNQVAAQTLFVKGDSWYRGANVPGKPRVFMPYLGGVGPYRDLCDQVAADGYRGFVLTTASKSRDNEEQHNGSQSPSRA